MINIRTAFFFLFGIYWAALIFCTFRVLIRAKIIDSIWDLVYDEKLSFKELISMKWDVSNFPEIDPNDFMLRFVTFSQKRVYYIYFSFAILYSFIPEDIYIF